MKRALIIVVFSSLFALAGIAQNLVPNPSFEDTIGCPDGLGSIDKVTGWINMGQSPDYFNSCINTDTVNPPNVGVPHNQLGYQTAFHGNAYAGLAAWYSPSIREFIGVHLTQNLVPGTKYFASAYISKADSVEIPPYTCSCNNFCFRFSTVPYDVNLGSSAPVDNFSHIHSDSIITDTAGWTRIAGSFVADSAYEYLIIGNFYDDANTDTSACNYFQAAAYYYVDDICVSADSLSCLNKTRVNELNAYSNEMYIYPNPVNSILHFGNLYKKISYTLTNITGQEISRGNLIGQANQIDISSIEEGIYFLNTETTHLKILIIH